MKYLYRILRLFFCPHKWEEKDYYKTSKVWTSGRTEDSIIKLSQCKYCGKFTKFDIKVK